MDGDAVLRRARVRKAADVTASARVPTTAARPARCPITVEAAAPSDGRRTGSMVYTVNGTVANRMDVFLLEKPRSKTN